MLLTYFSIDHYGYVTILSVISCPNIADHNFKLGLFSRYSSHDFGLKYVKYSSDILQSNPSRTNRPAGCKFLLSIRKIEHFSVLLKSRRSFELGL